MNRKQRKAEVREHRANVAASASAKRWIAGDSFQNFEARVGLGTNNQASQYNYGFDFISRNRVQMEAMYRSSWVVGQAVDVVADDMTRAGVDIDAELDPGDRDKLTSGFERMALWDRINDTIKWARLYGGALAVMLIDGQDPKTPLRPDSIGPDQFKGLFVLDRWLVQPTLNDLVTEMGPDMGMPRYYDVVADSMALPRQRIHYSRVLRIDGVELPYWQKISENLWGQSVIERLIDRLVAFDSTTVGAAQLVYKAHLRTLKVEKLREIIAMGGPALEALGKNVDMIRRFQSNEGMTLIDAADDMQVDSYQFSGLDNVLMQFGQQLSGALQIPLVRLFGQSPAGLNSTGESDLRTYYDNIKQQQERRLRAPMTRLFEVLLRSELGAKPPEGFAFSFTSLWQLSDTEKANNAKTTTDAVVTALDAGLIDTSTAMKELRHSSHSTGVFTSITDDQIEEAENEPPPAAETELPNADDPNDRPPQEGGKPGENERRGKAVSDAAPAGRKAGGRVGQWLSAWRSRSHSDD
uniref:Phage-associated protein, HI1409 family n=1 Tax=Ralstonia pickettii (strain 12D) TaxID=428406 RepID=C6BBT3_RALP1